MLNWIVGIYVGYTLVSSFTALPSIPKLAMEGTGGYRPVMWVIGLALGIGLTHVYDSYSKRSEKQRERQKKFNKIQSGQLVNRIAKGFFFFAIALGMAEVVLMIGFDTTLSRMVFDWANKVEGSYHIVGMVTGMMVMVSLLGARLNAWYRLSMLIVSMVSAHIFWHLGSDAYWPYDINHKPGHVEYMDDQDVLSPIT